MDGTRFGRYRLLELMGHGETGAVWRAFDPVIDGHVALKVLYQNYADTHVSRLRFRREARAAAGLDEPHVIPIHDFGEMEGLLFVAMRLINGCDLQDVLEHGPLPPAVAVGIIEQIASALHAAHQIGLVHRDVKPSNILIAEDEVAYLIDFGIARVTGEPGAADTGATMSTWSYMAPERFRAGIADARADVYGLACVLYQSLTGQLPFPVEGVEQLAVAHMVHPPPQPSKVRPGVPTAMDQVIATGMAKAPDQRYSTTKHLAKAARAALAAPTGQPKSAGSSLSPAGPAPQRTQPPRQGNIVVDEPVERPPKPGQPAGVGVQSARTRKHTDQAHDSRRDNRASAPTRTTAAPSAGQPLSRSARVAFGGITTVAVAALVVGVVSVAHSAFPSRSGSSKSTESAGTVTPPVDESVLERLLLSPDEVNTIVGATGMSITSTQNSFDDSAAIAPKACLALAGIAESQVYSGSGGTATRAQKLQDGRDNFTHLVLQAVVRFPSAAYARAFFNASAQQWAACQQYSDSQNKSEWTRGQVNRDDETLSAIATLQDGPATGWSCERALAAANNVIVDVDACRADPNDLAVEIAHQIAAKVPT